MRDFVSSAPCNKSSLLDVKSIVCSEGIHTDHSQGKEGSLAPERVRCEILHKSISRRFESSEDPTKKFLAFQVSGKT